MLHFDLQTLRLFRTVCEVKSVTHGANHLNMAASAASRRLRLLEDALGTRLLLRKAHGVEPTAAGLTVLRYARDVLHLSDRLEANLSEYRFGKRGHVRVFASSSALVQRLASDLAAFDREYPQIGIELEERPTIETLEALDQKETDIAIVIGDVELGGLKSFPYAEDRLNVILPPGHPLSARESIFFADIVDEQFVALDRATAVYRLVTEQARNAGANLRMRIQVRSFEAMCQMVHHGLGIGILPEHAGQPLADALGLRLLMLDDIWARRDVVICIRANDELEPQARRLIDFLLDRATAEKALNSKNSNTEWSQF